ncbi:MAG: putative quinol monooxygenase [Dongiaceae bacterium]
MIHVLAFITAQPGKRAQLLAEFRKIIPAVHAEAGCIEYGPATDTPEMGPIQTPLGPDGFAVVEKWETPEHLMAHAVAPHMKEYGARTKDLVASRVIHVLSPA